jgi:hypothetical protein
MEWNEFKSKLEIICMLLKIATEIVARLTTFMQIAWRSNGQIMDKNEQNDEFIFRKFQNIILTNKS